MLREASEERVGRLAALGGALSDPIRVRMLGFMARASAGGRGCCDLPEDEEEPAGICVCEFVESYDLAQSKASYHLGKLREAGLVREERRGRWSYYSLSHEAVSGFLGDLGGYLGVDQEKP
jgi:ArsR family transcriptional regulator